MYDEDKTIKICNFLDAEYDVFLTALFNAKNDDSAQ